MAVKSQYSHWRFETVWLDRESRLSSRGGHPIGCPFALRRTEGCTHEHRAVRRTRHAAGSRGQVRRPRIDPARIRRPGAGDEGPVDRPDTGGGGAAPRQVQGTRSEEHTSELQSLMRISYAVFCLKKKNT